MGEKVDMQKVRQAIADYMRTEGCSCCRDYDGHIQNRKKLALLLDVPEHPEEDDYYDFSGYRSDES